MRSRLAQRSLKLLKERMQHTHARGLEAFPLRYSRRQGFQVGYQSIKIKAHPSGGGIVVPCNFLIRMVVNRHGNKKVFLKLFFVSCSSTIRRTWILWVLNDTRSKDWVVQKSHLHAIYYYYI